MEQSGPAYQKIHTGRILKFIRPKLYNVYYCHNPKGIRLLHCPTYTNKRMTLLNKILEFSDAVVTKILLLGDNTLSDSCNTLILNSTIGYIISTKRFDDSILTPG